MDDKPDQTGNGSAFRMLGRSSSASFEGAAADPGNPFRHTAKAMGEVPAILENKAGAPLPEMHGEKITVEEYYGSVWGTYSIDWA